MARAQTGDQFPLIHSLPASYVDESRARLDGGEGGAVDQLFRLRRVRCGDDHRIGTRQNRMELSGGVDFVEDTAVLPAFVRMTSHRYRRHSERASTLGGGAREVTGADENDSLARHFFAAISNP